DPATVEVALDRSAVSCPPVRVATDRAYLLRALALGCAEVLVGRPDKAVQCRDRKRIFVWMPLDAAGAVPPGTAADRAPATACPDGGPPAARRRPPLAAGSSPNGHVP